MGCARLEYGNTTRGDLLVDALQRETGIWQEAAEFRGRPLPPAGEDHHQEIEVDGSVWTADALRDEHLDHQQPSLRPYCAADVAQDGRASLVVPIMQNLRQEKDVAIWYRPRTKEIVTDGVDGLRPLTHAELEHIKAHPELGCRILDGVKQLDKVLPIVRHHHEAWNGAGYPDGLKDEECPFLARVVAVADSIDAMSSDRPYRKGMPDEKLDAILRDGAGKQWDAKVVEALFRARDDVRQIAREGANRKPLVAND